MSKASDSLRGKVVVVTGASSGVGRAAAIAFGAQGCRVALAARRLVDLEETGRLVRAAGGEALSVVTDVTIESDVQKLAEQVRARFGAIDVWLNNAGVTLFAALDDAPFEEHRRVIETNLYGAMYGARAVLPIFKEQQRGILINVGSVLSEIGQPFVPSYAISKFALRGMSESLRAELADAPDIHVCTVLPFTIDTPHFQSGANRLGKHSRALPPVQSPEKVARAIVKLALHPRREVHVPRIAVLGLVVHHFFPDTTEQLLLHALRRWHFDQTPQRLTEGNLYAPVEVGEGSAHGDRRPQLSTASFIAWSLGELVRMNVQAARERLRGTKAQPGGTALHGGS
jgi:NAD(P)-dependent dehydrogenase (short-subunit alcohol dehydrogenase family)